MHVWLLRPLQFGRLQAQQLKVVVVNILGDRVFPEAVSLPGIETKI